MTVVPVRVFSRQHEDHIDWPVPERTPSRPGTSYHAAAGPEYERWRIYRATTAMAEARAFSRPWVPWRSQ